MTIKDATAPVKAQLNYSNTALDGVHILQKPHFCTTNKI